MPNVLFELDKLRFTLKNRGLDDHIVERLINNASGEIRTAFQQQADLAMQQAIDIGIDMRSSEFINELQIDDVNMELTTASGSMEFSEPPYPQLWNLLKNAKPMKDGSGVYKVIPVGSPSKNKPKIATNIYDSWKQVNAERLENSKRQYSAMAPKGSKFRTATSKQNPHEQWVRPAKDKNFTEDVREINKQLAQSMEDIIRDIIRSYEEGF